MIVCTTSSSTCHQNLIPKKFIFLTDRLTLPEKALVTGNQQLYLNGLTVSIFHVISTYKFFLPVGVFIIIPPMITQPPSDTTADLYSQVQLTCGATGNPQPVIHWFKDGERVSTSEADPPTLLLEEMALNNRGLYHCEATNAAGKVVSDVSVLNVKSKSLCCLNLLVSKHVCVCYLIANTVIRYCAV